MLLCFFCSCTSNEHQSPDYEEIADEITDKTARKLQKKTGLVLVGTGGQMMHDIQMMAMSFDLYHEIDLEKARELAVFSAEEYLKAINGNEEIRPYLHEYPFTAKNVEISIFIHNPDGSNLSSEKLHCISARRGKIKYYSDDLGYYNPLHEETYEEAVNTVRNQNLTKSLSP